ncbi:hypothetical protein DITRI_Ditri09bG0027600 [Diplodiscus trichospermus]
MKWLSDPKSAPWRMRRFVTQIINAGDSLLEWSIIHSTREKNVVADSLAKSGVRRIDDLVVYCN